MTEFLPGIPEVLSDRYRLRRELGAGGMAIVFEADDLRHDRQVAVKVMRPDVASVITHERFLREIAMVARLSHPHIVPLYDSGVHGTTLYFVMPVVGHETLRERLARSGPLPVGEIRRMASELGSALAFAHQRSVIHRDVKPENVLLADGGALLTDFGIARGDAAGSPSPLTTTGTFVGTPAYASPEQLTGDGAVGAASDEYSLACVIFEACVGHPPFPAKTLAETMLHHTSRPAPAVRALRAEISPAMESALLRAMAKAPAERFASIDAFLAAFLADSPDHRWTPRRWSLTRPKAGIAALLVATTGLALWGAGTLDPWLGGTRLPSLAVLPCTNLSGDASQEYFSDGVTEQIIAQLSTLPQLHVINILSVLRFKGERRPAREIGAELDADLLVWCGTNRQAEGVRISAQLVDVKTDAALWSRSYEERSADILRPQLEAALHIAEALRAELSPSGRQRLTRPPTLDDSAFALYMRGRHAWNLGTLDGLQRSIALFREAAARDPQFALAHAGLADAHLSLVGRWMAPPRPQYGQANAAVDLALAAQPALGEALAARGRLLHRGEWAWERAADELRRARRASPSAWQGWLDHAKLESAQGRHQSAINLAGTALRLDPLNALNLIGFAEILYFARRYDEALAQADRAIELEPSFAFNYLWRAMILLGLGRAEDAVAAARRATELAARHPGTLAILARAEAEAGRPEAARAILAEMDRAAGFAYVPPTLVAVVYMGLGENDRAFEAFERALEERDWFITEIAVHPLADPVRSDPRLGPLLKRLGLGRVPVPIR